MRQPRTSLTHYVCFVVFISTVSSVFFRHDLSSLLHLAIQDDRYSHVLVIPVMSALIVYLNRRRIFAHLSYGVVAGIPPFFAGAALYWVSQTQLRNLDANNRLSVVILAFVLVCTAGFLLCCGSQAFREALFPLLFLLFMVPIPTPVLDAIVVSLQAGSAVMTYALYKLLGVPVLWDHFKFLLPGVQIEIAQECSGIRSSLSLFITSILVSYLFLQSSWKKLFFCAFTIPVVILKNAVRIVTISSLGVYVDPGFLHGRLHRYGGLPFSLVSVAILVPLLLVLQKERAPGRGVNRSETAN